MERASSIVSIFFIVVILILLLIIMPDDIVFLPQWAGASCFLLPFTPTCVAEFIAAPATTNVRSSRQVSKIL
jgi:hypothetical protein